MNVLAFAATNSTQSINKQFVQYAGALLQEHNAQVNYLDLNDYEMPLYSVDREQADGIPQAAHDFYKAIGAADAVVISFAEHNGNYTAAYKNVFDWMSRIDMKVFQGKPVVFMAAAPGPGGAQSVLSIAKTSAPFFNANVVGDVSLPSFYDNFDAETGTVKHAEVNEKLKAVLKDLIAAA